MVYRMRPKDAQEARQGIKISSRGGFEVKNIKSTPIYPYDSGKNASKYFMDRVCMSTPYVDEDGYSMMATCTVEHNNEKVGSDEKLAVSNVELWTVNRETGELHRNYEDLYEELHGTRDYMIKDKNGWDRMPEDVENAVADCAVATTFFPYVADYDEYMAFKKSDYYRMGLGDVPDDAYEKYLDHCKRELDQGIPYVGEVRESGYVDLKKLGMPEYKKNEGNTGDDRTFGE